MQRSTEWKYDKTLSKRSLKKTEYNKFRAARDRRGFLKNWMQKYDVDLYSKKGDVIPDVVCDRDVEEAERLQDDTIVTAPPWWKNDTKGTKCDHRHDNKVAFETS